MQFFIAYEIILSRISVTVSRSGKWDGEKEKKERKKFSREFIPKLLLGMTHCGFVRLLAWLRCGFFTAHMRDLRTFRGTVPDRFRRNRTKKGFTFELLHWHDSLWSRSCRSLG